MADNPMPPQCVQTRPTADESWMLAQCFKIMMMQAGFAVVESSFVRQKNSANIMMKNAVDLALGALLYWAFGYALAYGVDPNDPENVNTFVGTGNFFLIEHHDAANWMFQLSFAATASTIDSGAVAERMQFVPYVIYSGLMTSVFYPLVCHWCWDSAGWLTKMGFHDFAGSAVVHLVGGASSLVAAWFIGPRMGRFADKGELIVTVVQGIQLKVPDTCTPYVVVRQLNHGNQELETRTAHNPQNPRWGTNLAFDVIINEESSAPKGIKVAPIVPEIEGQVAVRWTKVDDWMVQRNTSELSKHGSGAKSEQERRQSGDSYTSPRLDGSARDGICMASITSMLRGNNSGGMPGSPVTRGGPGRRSGPFTERIAVLKKDSFQLCPVAGATHKKEQIDLTLFEKCEDFGDTNILIHFVDLRVLEISLPNIKTRDDWLLKLLQAWRKGVSPMRLNILLLDDDNDKMLGEGKMTIYAVDKTDPEKFAIKTFVSLNCGGQVEIDATYTAPERMTREIFQACDPNKLLFGTFLLWVNWYSFNSGSTVGVEGGGIKLAAIVAINTTMSACSAGMFAMFWSQIWYGSMMVEPMATAILGGLVGVCASCDVIQQWEAIIIGIVSGFLSINCVEVMNYFKIDDPCAAVSIHFAGGLWGCIAVALFARPELCMGNAEITGLFHGGGTDLLRVQLLAAVTIIAWSMGVCFISLSIMHSLSHVKYMGLHHLRLRPTRTEEALGFDKTEHNIHRSSGEPLKPILVEANAPVKLKGRSKWTKVTAKRILTMVKNSPGGAGVGAAGAGKGGTPPVVPAIPRRGAPAGSGGGSDEIRLVSPKQASALDAGFAGTSSGIISTGRGRHDDVRPESPSIEDLLVDLSTKDTEMTLDAAERNAKGGDGELPGGTSHY